MKKCLTVLCVAFAAIIANASYLYWQVDAEDYSSAGIEGVTGARFVYLDNGVYHTVDSYYPVQDGSANPTMSSTIVGVVNENAAYAADIGNYSANAYSYYIELVKSNNDVIGRTTTGITKDSQGFSTYIASGTTVADLPATLASLTPWHGSPYSAVPEPTSAILMLFGAAMLGLKRKNRSIA